MQRRRHWSGARGEEKGPSYLWNETAPTQSSSLSLPLCCMSRPFILGFWASCMFMLCCAQTCQKMHADARFFYFYFLVFPLCPMHSVSFTGKSIVCIDKSLCKHRRQFHPYWTRFGVAAAQLCFVFSVSLKDNVAFKVGRWLLGLKGLMAVWERREGTRC